MQKSHDHGDLDRARRAAPARLRDFSQIEPYEARVPFGPTPYEAAWCYFEDHGLFSVPVAVAQVEQSKRLVPLVRWKEDGLFDGPRDLAELQRAWSGNEGVTGLAIFIGRRAGLVALDPDTAEGEEYVLDHEMPRTASFSSRRGTKRLLRYPEDHEVVGGDVCPGLELKVEGLLLVPPTVVMNGSAYRWLPDLTIEEAGVAPLPGWAMVNGSTLVLPLVEAVPGPGPARGQAPVKVVPGRELPPGQAHQRMLRIVGKLGRSLDPEELRVTADALNGGRLAEKELDDIVQHVVSNEGAGAHEPKVDVWDEPVEIVRAPQISGFPIDAFPEPLRSAAIGVARETQVDVGMAAMCGLAAAARACAGRWQVSVKGDWQEPLCIWVFIVAPPAERKSPTIRPMVEPLRVFEAECRDADELARLEAESRHAVARDRVRRLRRELSQMSGGDEGSEGLQAALDQAEAELSGIRVPGPWIAFMDDVTPEALAAQLARQGGRSAIISAEPGVFGSFDRYSKNEHPENFLKSWTGREPIRVDRLGRAVDVVESPVLTILVMGQPSVLARAQREPWLRERGLIARFILLRPPSLLGVRDAAPEPASALQMAPWRERMLELLRAAKADEGTDALILSPGAQDERLAFMREIEGRLAGEGAGWADWFGKLAGQAIRIAGLFHMIQGGPEAADSMIPAETMANAIAVARHLSIHARTLLRPVEGSDDPDETAPHQARLLAWIEARGVTDFSTRDACRGNRSLAAAAVAKALGALEERGYLKSLPVPVGRSGGRPTSRWSVNPTLRGEPGQNGGW